jgi:hypothetical protein
MIMNLIENRNFNKQSLGGAGLPATVDLTRFKRYCHNIYDYRVALDRNEPNPLDQEKVVWFLQPKSYNMDAFYANVGLRLQDKPIDPNYKDMTS